MDEDTLKELFEKSQKTNPEKISFTDEESNKFKKAFEDPEFRKLFSEYVDEMQDPKNREENEAYISQLENEKKVPEGKELIRYSHMIYDFFASYHDVTANVLIPQTRTSICCQNPQTKGKRSGEKRENLYQCCAIGKDCTTYQDQHS